MYVSMYLHVSIGMLQHLSFIAILTTTWLILFGAKAFPTTRTINVEHLTQLQLVQILTALAMTQFGLSIDHQSRALSMNTTAKHGTHQLTVPCESATCYSIYTARSLIVSFFTNEHLEYNLLVCWYVGHAIKDT